MSNLSNVVSKAAPVLGAVLNSVFPGSGLIVSGLMSLFGVTSESALVEKINADPEAFFKLRQFELQHEKELLAISYADTDSARKMNIETMKATGKTDYMLHTLAILSVGLSLIYPFFGFFYPSHFDKGVFHDLLNIATFIFSFYFGGMYVQSRNAKSSQQIVLPEPAKTR